MKSNENILWLLCSPKYGIILYDEQNQSKTASRHSKGNIYRSNDVYSLKPRQESQINPHENFISIAVNIQV